MRKIVKVNQTSVFSLGPACSIKSSRIYARRLSPSLHLASFIHKRILMTRHVAGYQRLGPMHRQYMHETVRFIEESIALPSLEYGRINCGWI